ncbi:MAG: transglycosylase SLT domain-containing protein [Arthrobacter sp.]|jgi:murein DD-endopeptidase MepM/ murein hydrolase activator NlpD|nr:transglycosylase SLT domain-containing protein [Arthrobacter sp.]
MLKKKWMFRAALAVLPLAVGSMLLLAAIPVLLLAGGGGEAAASGVNPQTNCDVDVQQASVLKEGTESTAVKVPAEYKDAIEKASKVSGLPVEILAAQIQAESAWNPKASSGVANGLAQFTPATWASYGQGKSVWDGNAAIDAQGRYMRDLLKQVASLAKTDDDKVKFALAAYNAGPGNVAKYKGVPPFAETQNYVKKILGNAQVKFSATCKPAGQPASLELGPGEWASPMPKARMTSGYGPRPCPFGAGGCAGRPYLMVHEGIDLAGGGSEYFYAPTDMEITYVGKGPSDPLWRFYGEYIFAVQVDEPHLVFEFHEAAQGTLLVKKGQTVKAGTPLGKPGATGNSSGIHVHFQINKPGTNVTGPTVQNGKSINPIPFLTEKGVAP